MTTVSSSHEVMKLDMSLSRFGGAMIFRLLAGTESKRARCLCTAPFMSNHFAGAGPAAFLLDQ